MLVPDIHIKLDSERFTKDLKRAIRRALLDVVQDVDKYLVATEVSKVGPPIPERPRCPKGCHPYPPISSKHQCINREGHFGSCDFPCQQGGHV